MDVTLTIRVWLAKLGRSFVHIGILAIPVSGLIISLSSLVPGLDINPAIDPDGFARVAVAVSLANLAGLVGGVILLLGFQALREYMSDTRAGFWSLAGMISSTAGLGLFLPFVGIFAFAGPVAARLYLLGNKGAITVVADSVSPSNTYRTSFRGALNSPVRRGFDHLWELHLAMRESTQVGCATLCIRGAFANCPVLQFRKFRRRPPVADQRYLDGVERLEKASTLAANALRDN